MVRAWDPSGTGARILHVVILAAWFGACLLVAAVLAPQAFQAIPSREIAANLVTVVVRTIDLFGMIAGPVLLVTLLLGWLPLGTPLKFRVFAVLLMTGATVASDRWLTPEMLALRHRTIGRPIQDLPIADPMRVELGRLHELSTGLFAAHALLALVLLVLAVAGSTPKRKSSIRPRPRAPWAKPGDPSSRACGAPRAFGLQAPSVPVQVSPSQR